jgi:hypothetical protein
MTAIRSRLTLSAALLAGLVPATLSAQTIVITSNDSRRSGAIGALVDVAAFRNGGRGTQAHVSQTGHGNAALIEQTGQNNRAAIVQRGCNNTAAVRQSGSNQSMGVAQVGCGHSLDAVQTQSNQRMVVIQFN